MMIEKALYDARDRAIRCNINDLRIQKNLAYEERDNKINEVTRLNNELVEIGKNLAAESELLNQVKKDITSAKVL